ncbi:DoxX family protein [Vulgatibacter incomptus]|uniref:DoxX family protein n=1 Tax=Vulgatibacter incomptus TaxID=1391653 RepID=A0A0K1P8P3_9BACT|nr:DoxX family protein [Vulgatibacter incomptus]AKU89890.1 hypothetical protein AKJ08_0277 [Vulgatibacter incomptus]
MASKELLLDRFRTVSWTLLRIVPAVILMQHGAQKLFGAFGGLDGSGGTVPLASLMGFAGILEFFVAALVVLGLFTCPAAFILSGEMAVGYFMAHAPKGFWPINTGGEPAVLLCFSFLAISAWGGGPFSLDGLLARRKREKKANRPVASRP